MRLLRLEELEGYEYNSSCLELNTEMFRISSLISLSGCLLKMKSICKPLNLDTLHYPSDTLKACYIFLDSY